MKTILIKLSRLALTVAAFAFILVSCQKDEMDAMSGEGGGEFGTFSATYPQDISEDVTTIPGDVLVTDHGIIEMEPQTGPGCVYTYKLDEEVPPVAEATIAAPEGFTGTITFKVSGNKEDGYYIEISDDINGYTAVIDAAYFKGGMNTYRKLTFEPGITSAGPLPAPVNSQGDADISHTWFCFSLIEEDNEECWAEETAFGGDTPGEGDAWWFAFDTHELDDEGNLKVVQSIYAGQKPVDGAYVKYEDGLIIIELGPNMELQEIFEGYKTKIHPRRGAEEVWVVDNEQVKVQGYNELPDSRPAAGQFTLYKGRDLEIQGDGSRFYVIHLDVEVKVDCD
jgi:hypothetical protein